MERFGRFRRSRCAAACAVAALAVAGCGEKAANVGVAVSDPGPVHVHGLGVNPADGSLSIATHTGLFRAARDQSRASRVAGRYQDTMGFTVVGPNRFLGSGHPDLRERLPPFLGLIESRDAGQTWRGLSLQGDADFHVLEARGRRVYGYGSEFESRSAQFLTSQDGGVRWQRLDAPAPLLSLAISPRDPRVVVASGERRVFWSRDGGRAWSALAAPAAGLLTWTKRGVFVVDPKGRVLRATSPDATWQVTGSIGGQPSAFDSGAADELLAALHDGTIVRSTDGGRSWGVRSRP